ncbi:family 4 polysaccharide lyase [Xylariaceae sp. FL1651]|nr:family 4 polysaccharide lyase [Xylariaceae sp. FL1651]
MDLAEAYPFGDVPGISVGTVIKTSNVYLVDGETHDMRLIDDGVHCATNSDASVHACFLRPSNQTTEKSSGYPFSRNINLNEVSEYQSLIYQQGFYDIYVFSFSRDGIPSTSRSDSSLFSILELLGYMGVSECGTVTGTASRVLSDFPTVLHWFNDDCQGLTYASSSGSFESLAMVDEFAAASASAEITASSKTTMTTATADIAAKNGILTSARTTIFQIEDYDRQSTGFLNTENQLRMHPFDDHMSDWSLGIVLSDEAAFLSMAIFADVTNGQEISFSLDSNVNSEGTFHVATTLELSGARPQPAVNDYICDALAAPGAYRGLGEVYDCTIPAGTLVNDANTVKIDVIWGSSGILNAIKLFY